LLEPIAVCGDMRSDSSEPKVTGAAHPILR